MKCVKCNRSCTEGDYCSVCTIGVRGWKADPYQVRIFNERRGEALEKIARKAGGKWAELAAKALWRPELAEPKPKRTRRKSV